MFGFRRRRGRHEVEAAETEATAADSEDAQEGEFDSGELAQDGPYDEQEQPQDGVDRLDLGSVRVPVPEGTQLQVEVDPSGPVRAVHMVTTIGRLTVSAFAAPRSGSLWQDVSDELVEQLEADSATVQRQDGEWGLELHADSPNAVLHFIGVDGPRWLLRGVAAGPGEHSQACEQLLREVMRGTVVVRGSDPMPVRTPLPIELPPEIAQHLQQAQEEQAEQA